MGEVQVSAGPTHAGIGARAAALPAARAASESGASADRIIHRDILDLRPLPMGHKSKHAIRLFTVGSPGWSAMKQYRVVGFDAEDEPLFEVSVEAPNQAIARIMVLAQICRNFATAPLADRTDKLVIHSNLKGGNSTAI